MLNKIKIKMVKTIEKSVAEIIIIAIAVLLLFSSCSTSSCAFSKSNYVKTYNMCPAYH